MVFCIELQYMTAYVDTNAPSPNACSKKNGLFVSENFLTFKLNRDKKCQKIEKKKENFAISTVKTCFLFSWKVT